jgi:hypothetical protein
VQFYEIASQFETHRIAPQSVTILGAGLGQISNVYREPEVFKERAFQSRIIEFRPYSNL